MQSPAEVIRQLEAFFDPDAIDLQIHFLRSIAEAYPKRTQARRELELLLEARRLVGLLIKQGANKLLGTDSPYFNDPELHGRDYWQDYESFQQHRVMTPPRQPRKQEPEARARASVQQQTPAQPATRNRNDLTRRSEVGREREERWHSPFTQGPNAATLRHLMNRIDAVFTQQKPQPEGWGDCEAVQSVEGTALGRTPEAATAEPKPELDAQAQPTMPVPVAGTSQGVKGADALNQLTPLQQAALKAIGNWLLVIGHCGSTKLTTDEFDKQRRAQARRQRPVQAVPRGAMRREVRRYATLRSVAGPGGACFRIAA